MRIALLLTSPGFLAALATTLGGRHWLNVILDFWMKIQKDQQNILMSTTGTRFPKHEENHFPSFYQWALFFPIFRCFPSSLQAPMTSSDRSQLNNAPFFLFDLRFSLVPLFPRPPHPILKAHQHQKKQSHASFFALLLYFGALFCCFVSWFRFVASFSFDQHLWPASS